VALPCGGDLTLAVAKPHAPAPTAAQQLGVVLATCVAQLAAGASDVESTAVVLGPAASGTRGAASAAVNVRAPSVGRQLAPEWPCLAAMIWHSRPQNHALRHRPQRNSLHVPLPHASHVAGAIAEASTRHTVKKHWIPTLSDRTLFIAKIPVGLL